MERIISKYNIKYDVNKLMNECKKEYINTVCIEDILNDKYRNKLYNNFTLDPEILRYVNKYDILEIEGIELKCISVLDGCITFEVINKDNILDSALVYKNYNL